ncbi:helix-turn-helix transcriptional regulator [Tsukamurella asaccharolytica]|uniref:Helix-turn-helix transcriptional regulator n=1 Tax=Tsukamurella asaccharolytica TaxID=2592067 RepID=A0A5C5RC31_9ACTN|nr:helix-turn-helix transcriptional regulator [Tsukamurella asaccharolytica]TWS20687.1 helix-turn-helix transcriptional regulator [Tsukamurella asaccharolytica]
MTRLPPDVRRLMRLRAALGATEDTHAEYIERVRGQAQERHERFTREHPWTGHRILRIRPMRERLRMSAADLAEATGMWEVEVEMIEDGSATASAEQLVELACALFTTVAQLEGKEPPRV